MKVIVKVFKIDTNENWDFRVIEFTSEDKKYSGKLFIDDGEDIPTELEIIIDE